MGNLNKLFWILGALVIVAVGFFALYIYNPSFYTQFLGLGYQSASQPTTKTEEKPNINTLPPAEQSKSLEAKQTVVTQIVVPPVSTTKSITQKELPKSLSDLIGLNVGSVNAVGYADKTSGYEIQYTLKNDLNSAVSDYFFDKSKNNGWKIVTSLKSAKAAVIDLDNAMLKAHVVFTEIGNSETTIKISAISK